MEENNENTETDGCSMKICRIFDRNRNMWYYCHKGFNVINIYAMFESTISGRQI